MKWNGIATIEQAPWYGGPNTVSDNLAGLIDHTLLRANAQKQDLTQLCREAKEYNFMSVCVNPYWVPLCVDNLLDSEIKTCTVIGFPLGANHWRTKQAEASLAIDQGADEIDMVVNIGAVKSGDWSSVQEELRAVVTIAREKSVLSKVILETAYLSEDEIVKLCRISTEEKADFVKTSTGFASGGAKAEDIALMRRCVGNDLGVKASGGVRDQTTALDMIQAGATRIGASSSIAIVQGSDSQTVAY